MIVPEVVKRRWWQFLLQNYRAEALRSALLRKGDYRIVVVSVPWYLQEAEIPPMLGTPRRETSAATDGKPTTASHA